jgi:hypothetical protein
MKNTWALDHQTKNYYYWFMLDSEGKPVYNCTKDNNPPASESGYYNLIALKTLKNDNSNMVNS